MAIKNQQDLDIEVFAKISRLVQEAETRGDYRTAELWMKRREIYAAANWLQKNSMLPMIRNAK